MAKRKTKYIVYIGMRAKYTVSASNSLEAKRIAVHRHQVKYHNAYSSDDAVLWYYGRDIIVRKAT